MRNLTIWIQSESKTVHPRKSQIPSCHATLGLIEIRNDKDLAVLEKQRIYILYQLQTGGWRVVY